MLYEEKVNSGANDIFMREAEAAFKEAISQGTLSATPDHAAYAGLYMYMYSHDGRDYFKHIERRAYLSSPATTA